MTISARINANVQITVLRDENDAATRSFLFNEAVSGLLKDKKTLDFSLVFDNIGCGMG